jgi:ABC-type cobalamin/Fe3+-siderophores transport system ATPase subunit
VTVIFGESGCGKSALVKSVLDVEFPSWTQVWFGPEELKTALSAARRGSLPLRHELSRVLNATVTPRNVLVIDSAERIVATEFVVIRQLLQAILPAVVQAEAAWHVVVVTQTQGWVEGEETMLGGRKAELVELEQVAGSDVKLALLPSPTLGWLAGHDDTIAALTNLRT